MKISEAPMKRPSWTDEFVRRRAAELFLPEVVSWLSQEEEAIDEKDVIDTLMKAMNPHSDGYEIVRKLEKTYYWVGSSDLMELMDGASWHVDQAEREMAHQWVRAYDIKPELPLGAHVSVSANVGDYQKKHGSITYIDPEVAQYGVTFDGMKAGSRYVVNYEVVKPWEGE